MNILRHIAFWTFVVVAVYVVTGCASYEPRFTGSDQWAERIKKDW